MPLSHSRIRHRSQGERGSVCLLKGVCVCPWPSGQPPHAMGRPQVGQGLSQGLCLGGTGCSHYSAAQSTAAMARASMPTQLLLSLFLAAAALAGSNAQVSLAEGAGCTQRPFADLPGLSCPQEQRTGPGVGTPELTGTWDTWWVSSEHPIPAELCPTQPLCSQTHNVAFVPNPLPLVWLVSGPGLAWGF